MILFIFFSCPYLIILLISNNQNGQTHRLILIYSLSVFLYLNFDPWKATAFVFTVQVLNSNHSLFEVINVLLCK